MTADPTTLYTATNGLVSLLSEAAAAIPWTKNDGSVVEACATPVEPAVECETIHVWPGTIETVRINNDVPCVAQPRVTINWRIATCIGAGNPENCAWWNQGDRAENTTDRLWGVVAYLSNAFLNGTLCERISPAAEPIRCSDVRFGTVDPIPSGDYAVWQGSIIVDLPVIDSSS